MAKKATKRTKKATKKTVKKTARRGRPPGSGKSAKKAARRGRPPGSGKSTSQKDKKLLWNPDVKTIKEFRKLLPDLTPVECTALEESIRKEGLRESLILWKGRGILVDGHNRYRLCKKHKIDYHAVEVSFENEEAVKLWILDNQASRRNMTTFQRIEATLKLKDAIAAEAKRNQQAGGGAVRQKVGKPGNEAKRTNKIIGDRAGVSHEIIRQAEAILEKHYEGKIEEKTMDALRSGKAKISRIYNLYCKDQKTEKQSDQDIAERSNSIIRSLKMQVARSFRQTEDRTSLYDKIIEWANAQKAGLEEPSE